MQTTWIFGGGLQIWGLNVGLAILWPWRSYLYTCKTRLVTAKFQGHWQKHIHL
jgi:hypothetical protein